MTEQKNLHYGEDYKYIPVTSVSSGDGRQLATDLYYQTIQIVNVVFVGNPSTPDSWTLIDAGMPKSAEAIRKAAEERFGKGARPNAIVLTHGHFDHVGAIIELVEQWDVPVYAHEKEIPYLTGKESYPEPDPTVDGGLVARMSSYFPNKPIQLGESVKPLPSDHSIPSLNEWKWIHTPGHTPGHVSFFREKDRALIAGDAFVTVKQDSLFKVLIQEKEITGPPVYYTPDWNTSWESVKKLEALKPSVAITGHGLPMVGEELKENLLKLANEFDKMAIPTIGRYIN